MIKAIILDFGGVIYKTNWEKFNKFFINKYGFSILLKDLNDEELVRIYKESDLGKENFEKFFLRIKPDLKNISIVMNDYKRGYAKFKILNKRLLRLVRALRDSGIKLFGFTDVKKEHYEVNKRLGIYDRFEKIFTSFELGMLKSDRKAFELLTKELKKYGLSPNECLFIDDSLENISKAKEMGYNCIHYKDFPKINNIKKELLKFFNKKIFVH
jgi:FMN phosphatase YigB (HAD superfamily)